MAQVRVKKGIGGESEMDGTKSDKYKVWLPSGVTTLKTFLFNLFLQRIKNPVKIVNGAFILYL